MPKNPVNKLWGASLLIAGTCIGAGMIGLPVKTAPHGGILASCLLVIIGLLMLWVGVITAKVALKTDMSVNFLGMITNVLGDNNRAIAALMFLFFLYSIMAAYVSGVASLLQYFNVYGISAKLLAIVPFIVIISLGAGAVDWCNRLLTGGLILSFLFLVIRVFFNYQGHNFLIANYTMLPLDWRKVFFAIPIITTSYGYHLIIPSLKDYLQNDSKKLMAAIIIGSLIPLVVYSVWQALILAMLPIVGENSLVSILASSFNPADGLARLLSGDLIVSSLLVSFSCFALTSSLLGVAWGFVDFFKDLHVTKKSLAILLVFIPPIVYAHFFTTGFFLALSWSAAFSAILLIWYPAKMANQLSLIKNWQYYLLSFITILIVLATIL